MPSSITRRSWIHSTGLGLPATAVSCNSAPKQTPASRPNIVLIVSDDQGYADLGCYGSKDIRTPRIDGLAARGVRFTRYYANAPECTPTRTALLTGRYQQRTGGLECAIGVGNVGRYDEAVWLQERGELGLPPEQSVLARGVKQSGYSTACFGKWHLGYEPKFHPRRHGFDEFFGPLGGTVDYFTHREPTGEEMLYRNEERVEETGYLTDLIAREATQWILRQTGSFFLYLPFTSPHTPIQDQDDTDKEVTESTWNKGDRETYARMVERLDWAVGEVLRSLEESGHADNTMVIFASDNGGTGLGDNGDYRGRKGLLFEGGIRVPCILRWPGVLPEGRTADFAAITMDLTASILGACGAAASAPLEGIDLLPVLREETPAPENRQLFFRYKRLQNRRKAHLDGDWKYLNENGAEHLFHLASDPGETKNLAPVADTGGSGSQEIRERVERMRQRLEAWESEVRAPRLAGFSPSETGG